MQDNIPENYSWKRHVGFNLSVLFVECVFFLSQVQDLKLRELWLIPAMLILGNFVVWTIHKYPLHVKGFPGGKFPYSRHTLQHHKYFTHQNIVFYKAKEMYNIMFPSVIIFLFSVVYLSLVYFVGRIWIPHNYLFLFLFGSSGYFLLYEFVHTASHLPKEHPLLKFKPLMYMRESHRLHHNPREMTKHNFGIVFPFADWILGTYKDPKTSD